MGAQAQRSPGTYILFIPAVSARRGRYDIGWELRYGVVTFAAGASPEQQSLRKRAVGPQRLVYSWVS